MGPPQYANGDSVKLQHAEGAFLSRRQTEIALIDWSYNLLSPDEQRLFERMSVFAGSCALEQAAAVSGEEAKLLGYVDACTVLAGIFREYTDQQEYDRVLAALRATVPSDDLAQLMAQGATLTPQRAIELALSV